MTPEQIMAALAAAPMFRDFTETGLRIFAGIATVRRVPSGGALFAENAAGESMLVVVEGAVRLTQKRAEGAESEVGRAGPGDTLGELAVLAPSVRLLSAAAAADCLLLEITQPDFLRLAPQKPQACLKLATAIAAQLARRVADSRALLREALARATPAS
jgi:CRP/FNR family cyclic AMP-dependent transcriptional regulator